MRTLLISEGLWSIVEKGFEEPENESQLSNAEKKALETSRMNDACALLRIQNGVSKAIFSRIMGTNTAKEAWDILQQEFHGNTRAVSVKLQALRKEFQNLKMKDSEMVKDYHSRVMEVVNQMKSYGENISDQSVVEKILISLTNKYEYIVAAIEESKDLTTLSIRELMGSLESHERRRLRLDDQAVESAFQSKLNIKPRRFSIKGNSSYEQRKPDTRRRDHIFNKKEEKK